LRIFLTAWRLPFLLTRRRICRGSRLFLWHKDPLLKVFLEPRTNKFVNQVKPRIVSIENGSESNVCNLARAELLYQWTARIAPDAPPAIRKFVASISHVGRFSIEISNFQLSIENALIH